MGGSYFNRLRRIVAGKAVELAFRRYLVEQAVPFDNLGTTPFTDPDRYDIAIGGRRCDIKSFLFLEKERIRELRRDPARLVQAAALVPADQIASAHLNDEDLYIFAFMTALVTSQPEDMARALAAGQPVYLIHPFPQAWARPTTWISLGRLVFNARTAQPVNLEIGGQGPNRSFQTEQLALQGHQPLLARSEFYSLAYLHTTQLPAGQVTVYSPSLKRNHPVPPTKWDNIWVYGMEIFLSGYITRGEFRRRARRLPAGSRVFQYEHTRTTNFSLSIAELYPINDLLDKARTWAKRDT
jgi:hypothetical protein